MAGIVIVLDTHALLWWALDPDKLSREANRLLADMEKTGGFASSVSIWEIAIKVKRGKLQLPLPVAEFTRRVERGGVVELLPVDTATWLQSVDLPWEHSDPADRIIVATAVRKGLPLLSKDDAIRGFGGVTTLW